MARKKPTTEGMSSSRTTRARSTTAESQVSIGQGRSASAGRGVTHDMIARRAYEIWESRGRVDGYAQQDWEQAERELRSME